MIVLCHKCRGNLSPKTEGLYECGCISSYIRSYSPTFSTVEEAREEQRLDILRDIRWLRIRKARGDSSRVTRLILDYCRSFHPVKS